ncbi:Galactose oxidase, central domain [Sphingobacterium psychroaquaticum]|uniref:Galactose oxidase, central domain n=2 Tax=Sphingobacterium psychroaquaticum TaxID=561061 RepID=A0A1X7JPM6_9SPHI|nr:Galactose oxidase, central domain [Sphingobacterium psychroaquaticum]
MTIALTACNPEDATQTIHWDTQSKLPMQADGSAHLGLAGPITGIIDNKLLLMGGANFPATMPWDGGAKEYHQEAYIYEIGDGHVDFVKQTPTHIPLAYSAVCSDGTRLYIAGGENNNGIQKDVFTLELTADSIQIARLPNLPHPYTNGGLLKVKNKLFFIGGENTEHVSARIYELNLSIAGSTWETHPTTLPYPVSHAIFLTDAKEQNIYIIGGRKRNENSRSTVYDQILQWNLSTQKIETIGTLPRPLAAGTGVMDDQGDILIFGGDDASTFHQVEDLIAKITATEDSNQKQILIQQKAFLQQNHPGFTSDSWKFNIQQKKWSKIAPIPAKSPVTTQALSYKNMIIIPSGEIKAGIRTDQILVGTIGKGGKHAK